MTPRLVILTEIISPYRIPLFNCLAQDSDISLHVIFLSENDPGLRQWKIYREEIKFSYEVLPSWRRRIGGFNFLLNRNVVHALRGASPDAILCGGYNYVASWQALLWARFRKIPFMLWSESNRYDARPGHALIELLKAQFLRRCDGFVVPGSSAEEYLRAHQIPDDKIIIAPNAVDNDLFGTLAEATRQNATAMRHELDLPARYILFVGRIVREKGVFELLEAYAALDESLRRQLGLVFVGDGPCLAELKRQASTVKDGIVKFPGFTQREELAAYYTLAEMFVLPTYTDTWGLVVNEAMACGLPVIGSRVAGCASDLIKEDWNGLLVAPKDVSSLKSAMTRLATLRDLSANMGVHSKQHITQYSPEAWSIGIAEAVKTMAGTH